MKLKMFSYTYDIPYGNGCGIVIAKTKEIAIEMIRVSPYSTLNDFEIEEIDVSTPQLIDHSWSE